MAVAESVVHLKRRVRSADTDLFEWRKCACRLTEDGQLVLATVDDDEDDEEDEAGSEKEIARRRVVGTAVGNGESEAVPGRVVVDLAWQLHALEQKRKCKTRCELQYVSVGDAGSKHISSEELMAPSPRHCEEWIELVREAEKRAKRRQSIRQGTATASAAAAMSALALGSSTSSSVVSSSGSHKELHTPRPAVPSQTSARSPRTATSPAMPFNASLSSVSGSSMASSPVVASAQTSERREMQLPRRHSQRSQQPQQQQHRTSVRLAQHNRYDEEREEDEYREDHDEELPSPVGARPTAHLPRASVSFDSPKPSAGVGCRTRLPQDAQLTHETTFDADDSLVDVHTPRRNEEQLYEDRSDDYRDDHDDEQDDEEEELQSEPRPARHSQVSLSSMASAVAVRTRHLLSPRPSSASSTLSPTPHTRRPSSTTRFAPSFSASRRLRATSITNARRQRPPSPPRRSNGTSSAAAVAASIQRLRRGEGCLVTDDDASSLDHTNGDTREELGILMRVENALRHLEHENALAKEREAALAHHVSTLQDALRVRNAEKKHLASHVQQLARDKDQWRQAAQRAEHALAQLQDELAIAQEETQLQQSERHRLKHQNKELLSQVHRLDSLVYGRF